MGSLFAQVYGNVGQSQPTGNCYVPWLELACAFSQLNSTALGSLTVSVTPVFPFFIFSSLAGVQGLPNTYMATVCYFGCGSCFPICLNFASTHCLSPKKSVFIKPQGSALMWPPLVNPLDCLIPACFSLCGMCTLAHMPVVRVSVHTPRFVCLLSANCNHPAGSQ